MDAATVRALEALDEGFYRDRAAAFSRTRDHAWPGWERVWQQIAPAAARSRTLRVLDAGCGNGRLLRFLAARCAASGIALRYVGLDRSARLLGIARARVPDGVRVTLRRADLCALAGAPAGTSRPPAAQEPACAGGFDLVAGFGLLHHVPGRARRRVLTAWLAERVAPGGTLALTFWRFGEPSLAARFAPRLREGARRARATHPQIAAGALEPGDHLLAWGDGQAVRYCHAHDAREIAALCAATGLECAAAFVDDGRSRNLDHYRLLQRRERRRG